MPPPASDSIDTHDTALDVSASTREAGENEEELAQDTVAAPRVFTPPEWRYAAVTGQRPSASPTADDRWPPVKPVATDDELREKYVWATLGVSGAINATVQSSLAQWQKSSPEEWHGAPGYGKRWVSAYAESAVAETTKYAVARLLRHDPSFTPCRCSGIGPRLRYALTAPFTSRKRDGRRVWSPAIFAGLLAGQMVSRTMWYPPGYGPTAGLESTATGLVSKLATSIWKEFRPRNRNLLKLDSYKP
jgi:hypothetical protein